MVDMPLNNQTKPNFFLIAFSGSVSHNRVEVLSIAVLSHPPKWTKSSVKFRGGSVIEFGMIPVWYWTSCQATR